MSAYVPVLVWVLSAGICYYIALVRNIKPTLIWKLVVLFIGPFAIPLVYFFAKSKKAIAAN